jgi:hypothetical protein
MKPDIDWANIQVLSIIPHQEQDWIEYKGRRTLDLTIPNVNENDLKNTLSKSISAFCNTGGGYLLLGINGQTFQVDDGGVDRVIKPNGTRSWLEDIIPTLVDPGIKDFNVIEISFGQIPEITDPNRAIYIIDLPDSTLAPHQASDNKYYGRIGGKSKPLSHRFVIDILGRRTDPQIDPLFSLEYENGKLDLLIILENNGRVMGNYVSGWVMIPKYLIPEEYLVGSSLELINNIQYYRLHIENIARDIIGINPSTMLPYSVVRQVPILRGVVFMERQELKITPFRFMGPKINERKVYWELAVDNSPMKNGEITFAEIINHSKRFDPNDL